MLKGQLKVSIVSILDLGYGSGDMLGAVADYRKKNDLQRSQTAYNLFKLITVFILNPMTRKIGLISVLRGFKKIELSE